MGREEVDECVNKFFWVISTVRTIFFMHALFVLVVLFNGIIYMSMAPQKQQLYKRTTSSIDLVVGLATIGTWHWTVGFC